MSGYLISTDKQQRQMLEKVGAKDFKDLYADAPQELLLAREDLKLPDGLGELGAMQEMERMAGENRVYRCIFRGAGAYDHYIPAIVKRVTSKEQFLTSYTPYQAEVSQGVLQSIFEYQSQICALTGMDYSNASVYDGASAAAEAAAMCRDRKRSVTLISAGVNPQVVETVKTYCHGAGTPCIIVPTKDGRTDLDALEEALGGGDVAGVCFQQPNYFGILEDAQAIIDLAHKAKAKVIMNVNPISLGILKTPGELGADIAVGEGQPLGLPLGFGGPYLGFMTATKKMMRHLPGRMVGETVDNKGQRCFVLTLQAREQHIRREKASSNVCSNEALCAMSAAVYLAAMGPQGMRDVAKQCYDKAHYLAGELAAAGYPLLYDAPFFHEFVTKTPLPAENALKALDEKGILGGLPVPGGILWCCTEKNTKAQMDEVVKTLREVRA